MGTQKVTCKSIAIGDAIVCRNYTWNADGTTTRREPTVMVVAQIEIADHGAGRKTYRYYTQDGTFINYAGGATRIEKVTK